MKRYEIRDKDNHKGWVAKDPCARYSWDIRVYEREFGDYSHYYYNFKDAESAGWVIPKGIKRMLIAPIALRYIVAGLGVVAAIATVFVALTPLLFTWDYHTGQDTGYISAVDKMMFSDDRNIYVRRRPLDAQGFTTAEEDETVYCTTADHQEVIDRAYEAMANGKRVVLVYDTSKPFGWRAIGHCNSAPITDIKVVEE